MLTTFTPKQLVYIGIILASIVLLSTVMVILWPKYINKWDKSLVFQGKENKWLLNLAYFLNYAITPLSVSVFYFIMSLVLFRYKEYRILGIGITSIITVSLAFWSLKRITQRDRPKDAKIKFKDFSFPSGHTGAGFVFFLSFALALIRIFEIHNYDRVVITALIFGYVIAWSRWYIKVHRLSDVIIGSFLGVGCFIFSYLLFFYFGDALFYAIEQVFLSM